MFTAQGPSVLHAIEVAVVQFAQVHLVHLEAINGKHGASFLWSCACAHRLAHELESNFPRCA